MDVGESIKRLRLENLLTQEQFGRIAGVSGMAVSQWECGRAVPRMGAIQRISDHFGIPKSAIMGDAIEYQYFTLSDDESREVFTDDERLLLELYRSLDETKRQIALYALRGMATGYFGDEKEDA